MDAFVRLLDLLTLLQGESQTGEALAARAGVTLRTVRRDIGRLREAGFTIEATPGVYGGYRLVGGTRMPPLVMSDAEALALAVALGSPATATVDGLDGVAMADLLAKLERLMPTARQRQVADLRAATVSSLRSPPAPSNVRDLVRLAGACRGCQAVEFEYRSASSKEAAKRCVEPYRLVQTSHCWYLVANDRTTRSWRTYRVDRMRDVHVTPTTFTRINPPEAERFVTEGTAVAVYDQQATVEVAAPVEEVMRVVPRSYGLVDPIGLERSRITIGFEDRRWLVTVLANLPWQAAVVEPSWLREELAELGRRLLAAHSPAEAR